MARPREFDRAVALDRAMKVFWERGGYEHTSIAQLTEAMGISSPSLYAAFGGKRALFDEAVAQYAQREDSPAALAIPALTSREVIERMLELAVVDYTDDTRHPLGCLINADPLLTDRRNEGCAVIADRLRRGQESGDLPDSLDPDDLAEFLVVLLNGMGARARDGLDRDRLRAVADIALRCWPSLT